MTDEHDPILIKLVRRGMPSLIAIEALVYLGMPRRGSTKKVLEYNKEKAKMINREVKQVICMRTDLNMRKGKMIAQGAHASIAFVRKQGKHAFVFTEIQEEWFDGGMTKIVVRVDSEEQLLDIEKKALEAGLTVHLITDAGLTEFKEPTKTCLSIGPNKAEDIDKITGDLKLL